MSEPTKLYYQLKEGPRVKTVAVKLTELEMEYLEELPGSVTEILREGLYRMINDHGYPVWEEGK